MSIYDLTKGQSKIWVEKYLNPFMEQNGFILKKTKNSDMLFFKKYLFGQENLNLGFLNSFPGTQIEYYYTVKINLIEDILNEILLNLNSNKSSYAFTFGLNQASIDKIFSNSFMPEMVTEEDVKKSCDLVIDFLQNIGFPLAQRFFVIKELDKEINGDNFWVSDWRMPFTLGNDFPIKRIIVAYLATNQKVEDLINFHINDMETKIKKGEYLEIHQKGLNEFLGAVDFLKDYFKK